MTYAAIKTSKAIYHVMLQNKGVALSSQQITEKIKKTFGKKELHETVRRQLNRLTNEEGVYNDHWLRKIGTNQYMFVDNPVSVDSVLVEQQVTLKSFSNEELINELKRRLGS